jgi:hypothetical protein
MSEPPAAVADSPIQPATAAGAGDDAAAIDESSLLRAYLASRDVECPQCNYNLRNLLGTRCPECGEELILRVQPVEPRQAAPLTGLVILSAGAGLNLLLLIYLLIDVIRRGGMGGEWHVFAAVNLVEGAVMSLCVVLWLANWRRIRRLDARGRWLLVVGCAALTLADIIFFSKLIR